MMGCSPSPADMYRKVTISIKGSKGYIRAVRGAPAVTRKSRPQQHQSTDGQSARVVLGAGLRPQRPAGRGTPNKLAHRWHKVRNEKEGKRGVGSPMAGFIEEKW